MSEHRIRIAWSNGAAPFTYETYPRNHAIAFKDGAQTLVVSGAPAYRGDPAKADPEDMLVAALSSCHMLFSWRSVPARNSRSNPMTMRRRAGWKMPRPGTGPRNYG